MLAAALLGCGLLGAEEVAVRRAEGVVHGFLVLRSLSGERLADGDWSQVTRGDQVTSRTIFRFRDGSLQDETVVFTQRGHFRLVSDHLVQKGPTFRRPMDFTLDAESGQVSVRYRDKDGEEKVIEKRMKLPPDIANGLLITLVKNLSPEDASLSVPVVAATPKPRLIKLSIGRSGEDPFQVGGVSYKAVRYDVKVEGLPGLLALFSRKSEPTKVWVLETKAPTFVRSDGPLFVGGPAWRIELTNPAFPDAAASAERPAAGLRKPYAVFLATAP